MENEALEVAHFERKAYELEIPGFEMYTIDDEMIVRSYKMPGSPRLLSPRANHHGGYEYNLRCYDDNGISVKRSFSPLRLYLCACAGLNPTTTTLEDFECDENGKPIAVNLCTRKGLMHKPGNVITSCAYRKQMTDKEKQQARAARQEMELKALERALITDDYGEVITMLYSYKQLVCGWLFVKYGVKSQRAEELFCIAVEHVLQRFRKDHWVISNFMGVLVRYSNLALLNKA